MVFTKAKKVSNASICTLAAHVKLCVLAVVAVVVSCQDVSQMFGGGEAQLQRPTILRLENTNLESLNAIGDPSDGATIYYIHNILRQEELYDAAHSVVRSSPRTFLEFGANNGVWLSNTYSLEWHLHWEGLLIEADKSVIPTLRQRRTCELRGQKGACVYAALDGSSNKTAYWSHTQTYSSKKEMGVGDHKDSYALTTVNLESLLEKFGVDRIDLLSADCEGCESSALQGFDWAKYKVGSIIIEHPANHCNLVQRLVMLNYTIIPLAFSYDTIFVSAEVFPKLKDCPTNCFKEGELDRVDSMLCRIYLIRTNSFYTVYNT